MGNGESIVDEDGFYKAPALVDRLKQLWSLLLPFSLPSPSLLAKYICTLFLYYLYIYSGVHLSGLHGRSHGGKTQLLPSTLLLPFSSPPLLFAIFGASFKILIYIIFTLFFIYFLEFHSRLVFTGSRVYFPE